MPVTTRKNGTSKVPTPTQEETSQAKLTLSGHEQWVSSVAFIPRTNLLVTSSADKTLRVWDLNTGKQVGEPLLNHDCAVWMVAASPDGCWIASGGWNGSILVWEVATDKTDVKREPVSFKGHEILLRDLIFAPGSETFASASNDLTICVWKSETGTIVLGPLRLDELPNSVSYSLDGKKLAAGTDKHIIVWNTTNGEELLKIPKRAFKIAFTPDSLRLVSGDWNDIRISDAATGDIIKQFDAHTQTCQSLAIAPNGSKFATTSSDKTTRFFDLTTFEPIGEPLEHPDIVICVAFSEDSQLITTGCEDKLVRTWTVPLSESEKESQQKILEKTIPGPQPRPRRAPIQTSRFFDDFDPGRNNRAATTTRHAEGSGIKTMMNRFLSRSSAPQGHGPRPRRIPLVDVFATRGKYRTANAQSGKRHLPRPLHPPRRQAHAGASSSTTPPAGTSNVVDATTPATLQTGSTNISTTTNHPSPLEIDVPDASCFAVLTRCFPRLSRIRHTIPAAPPTS
ncbi:WD40-repeat-containing domain protein [Suillus subalutaceus]|uniref:WD40-repeat-containing domain protein n=1 Tax=Suillus subalutaceus TaxID=48586 RepID=UPI001B875573|nr:WD40-repeat-containing domain protein [Suillus subalutaceus]KAG1858075.1 WD40-repeat-containing domain protein [Suillus subalutaceus]